MISLKVDAVTGLNRSFFRNKIQFKQDNKINSRILAIAKSYSEVLTSFQINFSQIYTVILVTTVQIWLRLKCTDILQSQYKEI